MRFAAAEEGDRGWQVAANAAWISGAGMAAIAMLAAARSVIREVRGLPIRRESRATHGPATQPAAKTPTAAVEPSCRRVPTSDAGRDREADEPRAARIGVVRGADGPGVDGDGALADDDAGDPAGRHLSKAERRRLRKLSRMNHAA